MGGWVGRSVGWLVADVIIVHDLHIQKHRSPGPVEARPPAAGAVGSPRGRCQVLPAEVAAGALAFEEDSLKRALGVCVGGD